MKFFILTCADANIFTGLPQKKVEYYEISFSFLNILIYDRTKNDYLASINALLCV